MLVSVIVPTWNEAERIGALLDVLAAETTPHEIIVADGGSPDGTARLAERRGARVLTAPRGRGPQLKAGAEAAAGDVLLFLHADTVLSPGSLAALVAALSADSAAIGGNFRVLFDGGDRFSRWQTAWYARIRQLGLYYGDSGMFLRRSAYDRLGGIKALPLMEDYDLNRRMERLGPTLCLTDVPLTTSSRKFRGRHPVAVVWQWVATHALYHLGVSPKRLERWYYRSRPWTRKSISSI